MSETILPAEARPGELTKPAAGPGRNRRAYPASGSCRGEPRSRRAQKNSQQPDRRGALQSGSGLQMKIGRVEARDSVQRRTVRQDQLPVTEDGEPIQPHLAQHPVHMHGRK